MSELTDNPFEPSAAAPSSPPRQTHVTSSPDANTVTTAPPPPVTNTGSPSTHSPSQTPPVNDQTQSDTQRERENVNDPGVIALRGMFPDYDDLILQSVLQSVGGNQDRAIDALLGMSDPDYRSEAPAPAQVAALQPTALSQEELDEQFARQLVLSEQQQQTEQWLQAQAAAGRQPPAVYRSNRPTGQQGLQATPGDERPNEFQDQFTKFAETGKKTIGNIFSKVKAKIQEFEQGRPATSGPPGTQQQGWNSTADANASSYYRPPPQSQTPQQPAYYDPNPSRQGPVNVSNATTPPVQGYDISSPTAMPSPPVPAQTATQQLQRQPSPQPINVPPPQRGTTLDGGKLGLLPKRPVTLLRDPSTPSASAGGSSAPKPSYHDDDDGDDDGLEYAENPFDSESSGAGKK